MRVPAPPPDSPANYSYSASIELNGSGRFFRFDLPATAPAWTGVPLGFGQLAVFDANGRSMRCGDFDYFSEGLAYRRIFSAVSAAVEDNPPPPSCGQRTPGTPACFRNSEKDEVMYLLQFDSVPDTTKQPGPALRLTWNHPPTLGGTINMLDDEGRIAAQHNMRQSENSLGYPIEVGAVGISQDVRIAVRLNKPQLRLLVRTRDTKLVLTSVERIDYAHRGDRYSHWFDASGEPPYRLYFDATHRGCSGSRVSAAELPAEASKEDWPPLASVSGTTKISRSITEQIRAKLDPGWWQLLRLFVPIWIIGLLGALVFRLARRPKN